MGFFIRVEYSRAQEMSGFAHALLISMVVAETLSGNQNKQHVQVLYSQIGRIGEDVYSMVQILLACTETYED